jgi:hypothetical protein
VISWMQNFQCIVPMDRTTTLWDRPKAFECGRIGE